MTDRELLRHITRSAGQKAGYKQLVRELGLGGGAQRRQLLSLLDQMTSVGHLTKIDREHWAIPAKPSVEQEGKSQDKFRVNQTRDNLAAGKLDLHRDGFGFVRLNPGQAIPSDEDIFIPPNEINGAMQGDQVLVEVGPPKRDGRRMGRIARVVERHNQTVVGVFHYARHGRRGQYIPGEYRGNMVTPFDSRMTQSILIPEGAEVPEVTDTSANRVLGAEAQHAVELATEAGNAWDDLEGIVVDVEITSWPTPTKPPFGKVIEILGAPDDFGVDVEMIIRKHQLPRVFPENVLKEAREVAHLDQDEIARRADHGGDFRRLSIVTIDSETAKDFDDAVLVTHNDDGSWDLQVHIADVAEYVRPGTDLDLEARLRGTSVYFPDRAIPMLPHELSTDICSLRPNEDRLVLSCLMHLTEDARVESYKIVEGVIRSAARMTYTEVHKILDGDKETREKYAALVPNFEKMRELAGRLNKRRSARGSIDFDLPEAVIQFDAEGQMQGVKQSERTWANRLIEEFMLAANECVATWIEDLHVPAIYRIHEKPDPRRVVDFEDAAAAFGYSLGLGTLPVKKVQFKGDRREQQRGGLNARDAKSYEVPEEMPVTPRMYQRLSARIAGKPEERILSYLMLRSLKQAKYSEVNEGHFALAAPSYSHFTSPIRRYPDLIFHRITKALLHEGISGDGLITAERQDSPWSHTNEGLGNKFGIKDLRPVTAKSAASKASIEPPIPEAELAAIAAETSITERRAADAERELVEWKKVKFMQDRVGEEFEAMVLNPAKYGLFVELKDLFVEGLVPIETLVSDRFTYRENTREIVGVNSGKIYRAGDQVRVILDRVLALERKLQFAMVEPPPLKLTKGGTKAGKPPKKKAVGKTGKAKASRREATRPGGKRKFSKKGRPRK